MTHRFVMALGLFILCAAAPLSAQDTIVVRSLKFEGNKAIDDATLSAAIGTTNSGWFARTWWVRWIGLGEKRFFDPVEFRRDVLRLTLLYRQSGFMEVKVDTTVQRSKRDVRLTFKITEGPPTRVTDLTVTGVDSLEVKRQAIVNDLPLEEGAPFNRFLMQASADTIATRMRNRGYPAVDVFRNFEVDRAGRTATVSLDVVPGPRATFGPVTVEGMEDVDSTFIRQLLATKPGSRFSEQDIFQSQRKLYQTQLFRFATVTIDSTKYSADSTVVPIAVEVSEGPPHQVRGSVGFATNDCFRGGAGWTDRNLFGTGRLFDISAKVSKVGVGRPFGFGLEDNICSGLKDDTIGSSKANYNVTAAVRQPRFFTPQITGTYSLFAERRSEFAIYRREEIGINVTLERETAKNLPIAAGYRLSYGGTEATAATFCAFFNACTPEDATRLREERLLGVVSASLTAPRQNNPLDPTKGHYYLFEVSHSSRFTGSARLQTFTRLSADLAWYRPIGRGGSVLSWHMRAGMIFAPRISLDSASGNFIPPEQRFYAGGPNDVRGYDRNELGPLVYVQNESDLSEQDSIDVSEGRYGNLNPRFSATGGNTLAVGQLELRVPSPVWRSRLKLAAFVDAGTLYERGRTNLAPVKFRVTPGFGLRVATPLGPARLDIGYNPYDRQPGPLYLQRNDGTLTLLTSNFNQPRSSRWSYHFSFGQPF
jgi:outer membrane protein assembly complex protein YaeT